MTAAGRKEMRELRRKCEAIVADVAIPTPFTLVALCDSLGAQRGRSLRVATPPFPMGRELPCGVWVALPDEDLIFLDQETSALHRLQIGLHEIGHILLGHLGTAVAAHEYLRRLMPDLQPSVMTRLLGRTSYDLAEEREAEMVATLLGERVVIDASRPIVLPGEGDAQTLDVLAQLSRALGGRGT